MYISIKTYVWNLFIRVIIAQLIYHHDYWFNHNV